MTDPIFGGSYVRGQNLPPADLSTIANQQPKALDGNVGADLSLDQDYTLDLSDGTTYRATMTLSQDRWLWLPKVGNTVAERICVRFDLDCAGFVLTLQQVSGGSPVASITGVGAMSDGVELFWHTINEHWYCLLWTANTAVHL